MGLAGRNGVRTVQMGRPSRWRELAGLAAMCVAVLLGLALLSYDYRQSPDQSPRLPCTNWVGQAGLYVAYGLVKLCGAASYVFPVFLAGCAIMMIMRFAFPSVRGLILRVIALGVLLVTGASFCALVYPRTVVKLNAPAGGMIGELCCEGFLKPYFGTVGSGVILGGLALGAILFLFDTSLRAVVQIARGTWRVLVVTGKVVVLTLAWIGKVCRMVLVWMGTTVWRAVQWVRARREREERYETLITITGKEGGRTARTRSVRSKPKPEPQVEPVEEKNVPIVAPPPPPATESGEPLPAYQKPTIALLDEPTVDDTGALQESVQEATRKLKETFEQFDIDADVVHAIVGPVITCYEVQPAPGVKVSKITSLENDIALAMKAKSIRIVAPIPGRDAVGIELPNEIRRIVRFSELMQSSQYAAAVKKMTLPLALGQTLSGDTFVDDLADMPHLLVAGATGSGKSVCINTILLSLLFRFEPHELKLVLVDPKHVELVPYHNLPHLLTPVLNEPGKVPEVLEWLIGEMDRRYKYFGRLGVRNIAMFNKKRAEDRRPVKMSMGSEEIDVPLYLPYIVVVIDELADLMLVAAEEIERKIIRLAQLARAAGIHLVLATQRPSTNVITGLIKANIPARIAFRTTSNIDSRVIIDEPGSEKLLGKGDMLYKAPSVSRTLRIQGAFVSEDEVKRVTDMIREQRAPEYIDLGEYRAPGFGGEMEMDEKFDEAVRATIESGQASASYLQRRLQIGYARAARLVDLMEAHGIIGPKRGGKPREILVDQWPPPSA